MQVNMATDSGVLFSLRLQRQSFISSGEFHDQVVDKGVGDPLQAHERAWHIVVYNFHKFTVAFSNSMLQN